MVEFADEHGLHYNLPAGGTEPGESLIEAVKHHEISVIFDCTIINGTVPKLSDHPDTNQIGVRWIPLSQLNEIVLYPNMRSHIAE